MTDYDNEYIKRWKMLMSLLRLGMLRDEKITEMVDENINYIRKLNKPTEEEIEQEKLYHYPYEILQNCMFLWDRERELQIEKTPSSKMRRSMIQMSKNLSILRSGRLN